MKRQQKRLHIWKDCDERMAEAVISLKQACEDLDAKGAQRLPVKRLIREHLDPALEPIISDLGLVAPVFVSKVFAPAGLSGWHKDLTGLDVALCKFAKAQGSRILGSIDTLREAIYFLRRPPPIRKVSVREKGLKGAARLRKQSSRSGTTLDWPYCELCYRVTEAAYQELVRIRTPLDTEKIHPIVSARYCRHHSSSRGRSYDRDFRYRERFREVLAATFQEFSKDRKFSHRFAGLAPEDTLPTTSPGGARLCDLEDFSDQVCNVRHYAYLVARQRTLDRTIEIAIRRASGPSYTRIAKELGISPSAVTQRVKKSHGCFDFSRSNPLLFWWPDSLLRGRATFKLSSTDPVPVPIAQLARRALIGMAQRPPTDEGHAEIWKTVADQLQTAP